MSTEFRILLQRLSHKLSPADVEAIAASAHLPDPNPPSGEAALASVAGNCELGVAVASVDAIMDVLKQISRGELVKEVKAFKKKFRKKLAENPPRRREDGYENFDAAEREAAQVLATLQKMEGCGVVTGVDRMRELHAQAKEAAENLLRVVRRANHLSRSCHRSDSRGSEPCNSPPSSSPAPLPSTSLTSSTEAPEVGVDGNVSPQSGFKGRLNRKLQLKPGSKTERSPSPKAPQQKCSRSYSEKSGRLSKTPSSTTALPLPSPPRVMDIAESGSEDDDDIHEYTHPDVPPSIEQRSTQTQPQQVPQRPPLRPTHQVLPRGPIPVRHAFNRDREQSSIQRQNRQTNNGVSRELLHEDSESDGDEYDDVVTMFEMQNTEKMDAPRSKPTSLHGDTRRGRPPYNDQSSTCSTPSSEVTTPPAILPKPPGAREEATPAIPIRRSSLKSGPAAVTAPVGHPQSGPLQSGMVQPSRSETTTPNQPIMDIHQQLRQKQSTGSPHSLGSSYGGSDQHPVSLAKALEMSSNQSSYSDCTDSCNCTGDSGFDEYTPVSTAWHRNANALPQQSRTGHKVLKQHSVEPQQSYTNLILSPTSPPLLTQHTTVSHLAPIYGSNNTTPSPPSDHTTISAMGPMYKPVFIEEPTPEMDESLDDTPDYVNVTQYVEPT